MWAKLRRFVASAAVLVGLAALAAAWMRPDLFPRWARIAGREGAHLSESELFCREHGVPEAYCTICHPELTEKLLLCPEHGNIPEGICTLCHPEVQVRHKLEMCPAGHGLPKHFCRECGTSEPTAMVEPAPDDGWCATHSVPEELCSACEAEDGTPLSTRDCAVPLPLVRLASSNLAHQIGIETSYAIEVRHAHEIEANAETAFDGNRFAEVSARVKGYVSEVRVDLGQQVRMGEVLALVETPELSAAKSTWIAARAAVVLAKAAYERTRSLAARDAVPAKQELEALTDLNKAESEAMNAAQFLRNLGLSDSDLQRVIEERETAGTLAIAAPIDGMVVSRHAVHGEAVEPSTRLFSVADVSNMWIWIDVYEADVPTVEIGQIVRFRILGGGGTDFEGRVTWVGAEVDPIARTTKVRAELPNIDRRLRANQFGIATIRVGREHRAIEIPAAAVQRVEGTEVVFVPVQAGLYRPQRIVAESSARNGKIEVTWGLRPGDEVVTRGAFLLKTEISKSEIGGGCCVEPAKSVRH